MNNFSSWHTNTGHFSHNIHQVFTIVTISLSLLSFLQFRFWWPKCALHFFVRFLLFGKLSPAVYSTSPALLEVGRILFVKDLYILPHTRILQKTSNNFNNQIQYVMNCFVSCFRGFTEPLSCIPVFLTTFSDFHFVTFKWNKMQR